MTVPKRLIAHSALRWRAAGRRWPLASAWSAAVLLAAPPARAALSWMASFPRMASLPWLVVLRRGSALAAFATLGRREASTPRARLPQAVALSVLLSVLLLLAGCDGRPRSAEADAAARTEGERPGALLAFDLSSGIPDDGGGGFFALPAKRTYVGLVRALERAATEGPDHFKGVFVELGASSFGWAQTEELGRLFGALRSAGRPVVCHAHGLDNAGVWLVTRACDHVWLSPSGNVDSVGLAGQSLYLKGALDKLAIRTELLAMGRYKSAGETLTRDGPSEESRESLLGVLRSIRRSWLDGIRAARPGERVGGSIETGPWTAAEALARGLIDAVGYEDQARKSLEQETKVKHFDTRFGGRSAASGFDVAQILRTIAGADSAGDETPYIALVPALGSIGMEARGPFDDAGISARAMEKTLRRLAEDDAAKAVVLRIDSPGGSALASDLIWHEVMRLREKKPVVASVGDMAASGGYYIACAANTILAERTSIIGSIGVVGGKVVLGEALATFGVHVASFAASDAPGAEARATYLSALTPWDDATRDRVRAQMQAVYDLFIQRVAKGRSLPESSVRKVAEGRIWSGAQGKESKLIDDFGGLAKALATARRLSGVGTDTPVRVEGGKDTLLDLLALGEGAEEREIRASLARLSERRARWLELVPRSLVPYLASLAPLAQGERVVTALAHPFTVR